MARFPAITRLLGILAILWTFGFVLFVTLLPGPLGDVKTDGVVVLTGAPGRIDHGIALMRAHDAKRMLISGVAPEVRPDDLAAEYDSPAALFDCCIDLGHEAVDTRSNAEETAAWVHQHGYKSVRLVTSDWHLPRARMELANALGNEVTLVEDGVPNSPRFGLLVQEYNKLLIRRVVLWTGIGE